MRIKSAAALAALTLVECAFAGAAHAQSSVTMYGIVDDGFNWTSNAGGHNLYNVSSGLRVHQRQIALPADDARKRLLAFEQRDGR